MANPVKVSVVVPVYNTAPYLEQCLDSIVGQSLADIEIICVDDGSTDESPAILESYAAKDLRLKVIHQQNQFAGTARNNGMAAARGEYIMFCDSDDFMAENALELMYEKSKKDEADICVCAGKRYYEQLGLTVDAPGYLEVKRVPEKLPFNRSDNAEHLFSFTTIMMFNKMFRLDFLRERHLQYATTRNGEDVEICALALWYADRITVVKTPLVVYRIDRPDSLVGTLSQAALDPLYAWMRVWRAIGSKLGDAKRSFDCKFLGVARHTLRNVTNSNAFDQCFDYLKSEAIDVMDLRVRKDGYYYTPWYNEFVSHLRDESCEDFKVYMLFATNRDLDTEEAKRLDFRRRLRESEKQRAQVERAFKNAEKERAEIERKFSKVKWLYSCGRAALRLPRRIRKELTRGREAADK